MKKSYQCAVCKRVAPSGSTVFVRNVPIGPTCLRRLRQREYIRGGGPNSRLVRNSETGWTHQVSDYSDKCPPDETHCLQCPYLKCRSCPAEDAYGHLFVKD